MRGRALVRTYKGPSCFPAWRARSKKGLLPYKSILAATHAFIGRATRIRRASGGRPWHPPQPAESDRLKMQVT